MLKTFREEKNAVRELRYISRDRVYYVHSWRRYIVGDVGTYSR